MKGDFRKCPASDLKWASFVGHEIKENMFAVLGHTHRWEKFKSSWRRSSLVFMGLFSLMLPRLFEANNRRWSMDHDQMPKKITELHPLNDSVFYNHYQSPVGYCVALYRTISRHIWEFSSSLCLRLLRSSSRICWCAWSASTLSTT